MKIDNLKTDSGLLSIEWSDGRVDRYHFIWLRDHLPDVAFFDPSTGERLVDAHSYLGNTRPESVSLDGNGDLVIAWPGLDEPTRYPANWLHANAYGDANLQTRETVLPQPAPWPFRVAADVERHDFHAVMENDRAAFDMLRDFRTYGFAFIENAPAAPGVVEALCNWLGYVRDVAFGRVREIRSEPSYDNVAFTSRDVKPHIDGSNYIYPYEVQFLHCIENGAVGGDSDIVDGFAVAEKLKAADPSAFDILTRVKVPYKIGAGDHDIRHSAPVIELDRDGALHFIRFSNQQRRILSIPFDDVEPFYAAYAKFSEMINSADNRMHFRFKPGEVLMFDNHRMLHARDAFEPDTGRRHMQLATADMDMVDSKFRRLMRGLRVNENLDVALPGIPGR